MATNTLDARGVPPSYKQDAAKVEQVRATLAGLRQQVQEATGTRQATQKEATAAQEELRRMEDRRVELTAKANAVKVAVGQAVLAGADEMQEGARMAGVDAAISALEPSLRRARRNVAIATLNDQEAHYRQLEVQVAERDTLSGLHYLEALALRAEQERRDGVSYLRPPAANQDYDAQNWRVQVSQLRGEVEQRRLRLDRDFPL